MQANDYSNEPNSPYAHPHRYTSSSEFSLGGIKSTPRSESGTSHTHYDDHTPPPPKVTMDAYAQLTGEGPNGAPSRQPSQRSLLDPQDPAVMRALVERAAEESQNYEVMTLSDFEKAKQDHILMERRVDGHRQKLQYESKIRDAAQRMAKLDPSSDHDEDLAEGVRKVAELHSELSEMERESARMHTKLIMHSAGVLQMQHRMQRNGAATPSSSKEEEDYRAGLGLHDTADGIMDITELDVPSNPELQYKLLEVNSIMYDMLNDPGMTTTPEYPPPPPEGAGEEAYVSYLEDGLNTIKELYQELTRYVQETQASQDRTTSLMNKLWHTVHNGEQDMFSHRQQVTSSEGYDPAAERELHDLNTAPADEEFSHEAFASKIQRLASNATALSPRQVELHSQIKSYRDNVATQSSQHTDMVNRIQEAHDAQLQIQRSLDESKSHYANVQGELGELRQELTFVKQQKEALEQQNQILEQQREALEQEKTAIGSDMEKNAEQSAQNEKSLQDAFHQINQLEQERNGLESERSNFEAEVVRMQTELTMAKAELDAAYGTRAERAAEAAAQGPDLKQELISEVKKREEAEARIDTLQRELREMVSEYEGLVRQGVETEREREMLENMNDSLRDKNEDLLTKAAEERIQWMGRKPSTAEEAASNGNVNLTVKDAASAVKPPPILEATTMRVMREEFKKMMREARSDHFKALRAEQEERRKLESTLRSVRKEHNHIAAQGSGAGSSTLSPVTKKSGLSHSVTAD